MDLIFVYLCFGIFQIMYANTNEELPGTVFPTLESPDITFIDVGNGCGGFTDCIEYVGAVLFNIGAGLIFLVLFIINLLVFVFELFTILIEVSFTGIDGAHWTINLVLVTMNSALLALLIFAMIRAGRQSTE